MVIAAPAVPFQRGAVLATEVADKQPLGPGALKPRHAGANWISAVWGITCPVDKITGGILSNGHTLPGLPR